MKISELVKGIKNVKIIGDENTYISSVACDSSAVIDGSLFFCINGYNVDGNKFIRQVEIYGALAVVSEKRSNTKLVQIIVKDVRMAMSIISANFYGNVDKKMKIIGVTGTNGKTSTCNIIKKIFDDAKIPCGVIGTLGVFYKNKLLEPTLTTPDPIDLHRILSDMYKSGVAVVVMEVSAHALDLKKVYGLSFEMGVFTNLSQDHLDYFKDMATYRESKLKLFKQCKYVVSNSDDEVGLEIIKKNIGVISYGLYNPADVFGIDLSYTKSGTSFILNLFDCVYDIKTNLLGEFNVYNVLASSAVCALMGVGSDKIAKSICEIKPINGRIEKVYDKDFSVFIDYAHTPDGLEKVLKTLRKNCKNRLICVFGCGGNRDSIKRKIMGEISAKISDYTVITTDNPRFEDPVDIMCEIEKGVLEISKQYVLIQDRVEAIKYAMNFAKPGDVVLIAGKGAENYQEVLGIKHSYNDKDTIKKLLRDISD